MKKNKISMAIKSVSPALLGASLLVPVSFNAQALNWLLGDFEVDLDTTITYAAAARTESRNQDLLVTPYSDSVNQFYSAGRALEHTLLLNKDDGNQNFDTGLISNRLNILSSLSVRSGNWGLFLRGNAYYDAVYDDNETDNQSPFTYNYNAPYNVDANVFPDRSEARLGQYAEILDAFIEYDGMIMDSPFNMRVGQQVVSWGESLRTPNGINFANVPVNAVKLFTPGVALNEVFLPVEQAYFQFQLTDDTSLEMYYQWEWQRTRIPPVGSYYSTVDILEEGGTDLLVPGSFVNNQGLAAAFGDPALAAMVSTGLADYLNNVPANAPFNGGPYATIDRAANDTPDDDGQYGIALRTIVPSLNEMELGFYYVRYHDKNPNVVLTQGNPMAPGNDIGVAVPHLTGFYSQLPLPPTAPPAQAIAGMVGGVWQAYDNSSYHLTYVEDIDLFGISISTVIGDTTVASEVSLRDGQPVPVGGDPLGLIAEGVMSMMNGGPAKPGDQYATFTEEEVYHWNASALHIFGPSSFADNASLILEV
jgi:hypothetical protein